MKRKNSVMVRCMSLRCRVCNAVKIPNNKDTNSETTWECQNCGNMLDVSGHVVNTS